MGRPGDAANMWAFEPIHYGDAQPALMQEIQAVIAASIGVRVKYAQMITKIHAFATERCRPP